MKEIILNKECGFDNYYEGYGHGSQMRTYSEDIVEEVYNYLKSNNIKVHNDYYYWFKCWFLDGFNQVSDSIGFRPSQDYTNKFCLIGYLRYCDLSLFDTIRNEYIEY